MCLTGTHLRICSPALEAFALTSPLMWLDVPALEPGRRAQLLLPVLCCALGFLVSPVSFLKEPERSELSVQEHVRTFKPGRMEVAR